MKGIVLRLLAAAMLAASVTPSPGFAAATTQSDVKRSVDPVVGSLMQKEGIHGMAVGIIAAGKSYVFDYGVASIETRRPVTNDTLFELGSISKTLTATLASYAEVSGDLSLSDSTSKYMPALAGTKFGEVELLNLGTHTPGGVPLQVPDEIKSEADLIAYLKAWRPSVPPGTYRTYSNLGIGLLGEITATTMGGDFKSLMQRRLFPALGMKQTFIDVPKARTADYAQGYTKQGAPVRMKPGVLSAQAYGVKTTAADMLRFVQANMNLVELDDEWQRAVARTHTSYFQAGPMTQDLIWEQYAYPATLSALLEGNSAAMILHPTPVSRLSPPQAPRQDVWINKTGSTNGFGAYVAFIPKKQIGIVMLANKNFPIHERVRAAYEILSALAAQ